MDFAMEDIEIWGIQQINGKDFILDNIGRVIRLNDEEYV